MKNLINYKPLFCSSAGVSGTVAVNESVSMEEAAVLRSSIRPDSLPTVDSRIRK